MRPMAANTAVEAVEKKAGWGVIAMLAAAQFVMVLDTTVMNVSISQIVEDLNTTVVGLQTAITVYTLVMAAFMLIGGKLGDKWGARRAYAIGLLIYGAGSLTTALSPNLAVLLVGWSFIEGFGAVLVIPAIAALTAVTYSGRQRALAYGILGGVSGASAAIGPLIGGWVTANYTWRLVFASETVVVLLLMLFLRAIPATPGRATKLDLPGAFLSAAGLGLAVFGILRSSQWGWIGPKAAAPFTPLGLSPVFWLIIAGGRAALALCPPRGKGDGGWQRTAARSASARHPRAARWSHHTARPAVHHHEHLLRAAALSADGARLRFAADRHHDPAALALALCLCALGGASLAGRMSPKRIVEIGLIGMLIGEVLLIGFTGPDLRSLGFGVALALVGAGLGLLASQLGNINMSAVPPARGSEVGGLQGTAQNLGASLGTALIGSILIASLVSNFQTGVLANPALAGVSEDIAATAEANANFVTTEQVRTSAEQAGLLR
jgi:MFS family permease